MADTLTNEEALALIARGHAALSANLAKVDPPKEEPPPPATVTKVATLVALTAALKAAKDGDVIELAPGDHGSFSLKGLATPGRVKVLATGAKVTGLQLTACEGIVFQGLAADLSAGGVVRLDGCMNIDLVGLTSRNATLYGVSVVRSVGVKVVYGDFADVKDGVHLLNCRDVLVKGNKIRRFRADGVNMSGSSDVKVIGNDIADCLAALGGHPDGVQVQTSGAAAPAVNIEIRGNKMRRGSGVAYQGVFVTVQAGGARHRDVVVAENDIEGGLFNGIMVASADDVVVAANRVQPYTDQKSWIRLANCDQVRLSGNAYTTLILEEVTGLDRQDKETLSAVAPR